MDGLQFLGYLVQSQTLKVVFGNWPRPLRTLNARGAIWQEVDGRPKITRQCCHEAPPPGEEEDPKPAKDKKRKRVSPSDTPNPKKRKAHNSKNDTAALPANVAQKLQDEEKESKDADYELVARKKGSAEASKAAKPVMLEEAHLWTKEISGDGPSKVPESSEAEDISRRDEQSASVQQKTENIKQFHEEAKMKEVETLGWKQNMDRLASKKDTARAQLSSAELQLQSMKDESLARAKKIEDLETRLAAEIAKTTSKVERVKANAEAVVAVYRADVEVAHTRAKEISDVA
ncbi:uncharacterized protein [Nicotiana sylvestris]|uniref:uncharacterized protein n=1 Tax=Nicotiana sylvestris TaxID=4096 RepID=UPI00388C73C2